MTNWQIADGRSISTDDMSQARLVVVLGQTVARQLFGANQNPVGAAVQVKSVPMRVIGILVSKGQSQFGTDQDDLVMIPFSTAERKVLGSPRRLSNKPIRGFIRRRQTPMDCNRVWSASSIDVRPGHGPGASSAGNSRGNADTRAPPSPLSQVRSMISLSAT